VQSSSRFPNRPDIKSVPGNDKVVN
jgi:hypothetical protein